MNKNPLNQGMIEKNSAGIGEISNEMIKDRAGELALIAGRHVTEEDRGQAVRELSGGDGLDARQVSLVAASEDDRWDPIHGSTGHQAEESASEDEGENGQGQSAQLYEEGVREAAHDQMLQAAIATEESRLPDS